MHSTFELLLLATESGGADLKKSQRYPAGFASKARYFK